MACGRQHWYLSRAVTHSSMKTAAALVFLAWLGLAVGECPKIISRSEWGARTPKGTSNMTTPATYSFIHHTVTNRCTSQSTCSAIMRSMQNYHMDTNGFDDIGYSFVIGEDGNVYEGRGWMVQGAHTGGYNSVGHGFSIIGDFTSVLPNNAALTATKNIIAHGVCLGHSVSNYKLKGHKDVRSTECPGDKLYEEIQGWPNYEK